MPAKPNLKPVVNEQNFAEKILAEIAAYEKKNLDKMSALDLVVSKRVKEIVSATSDAGEMINKVFKYLKGAWGLSDILYTMVFFEGLKDRLLSIVGELDKDYRIKTLTANNNSLISTTQEVKKNHIKKEKSLKSKHELEVEKLKKEALLDKKHLEKSVESLSGVIQVEVISLKEIMLSKNDEVSKLQAENARLLQLTCKLQQQVHSKPSVSNGPS